MHGAELADASAVESRHRPITTIDLLKLVGLVFVLVDHYGLFFDPEQNGWRLPGRIAAPIFFFLIGFARTRTVPWTWIAFGAVLTLLDYLTSPSLAEVTLNILLNFALLRFALLPFLERWVMPSPWRVAGFVALCLPLIDPTDPVLEYGTEGWLWALFGLAHRLASEKGDAKSIQVRNGIAGATGVAYVVREIHDYVFGPLQSAILVAIVIALLVVLAHFRRAEFSQRPPPPLAALLHFCGRHSLEIYAVTLFGMRSVAYAIGEGWIGA